MDQLHYIDMVYLKCRPQYLKEITKLLINLGMCFAVIPMNTWWFVYGREDEFNLFQVELKTWLKKNNLFIRDIIPEHES
jgi:hypothetical protein